MARVDTAFPLLRDRHRKANLEALGQIFADQAEDVQARLDSSASVLLARRWDAALQAVLLDRNTDTAGEIANRVARALGGDYDPVVMDAWLAENARIGAENINTATRAKLDAAKDTDDSAKAVATVLEALQTSDAAMYAVSMVTSIAGFAARDAAEKSGAAAKIWRTNSTNPRSEHRRMNGQTVPVGERFSNGMDWPGDFEGGADEVAGCKCSLTILS